MAKLLTVIFAAMKKAQRMYHSTKAWWA